MAYKEVNYCACGNICEGSTKRCASCNFDARKAERQSKKVKVIVPVKKVTVKRAAQNVEYLKLRREYLEAYPACEVPECDIKSVEIHHQRGRENEKLLDTNYFMAVCHKHHVEFTEHSKKAIEDGHSFLRSTNDSETNNQGA